MVTTSLNNIATLSALWTLMFMLFSGGFALSTMSKSAPQTSPLGDMLSQKVAAAGGSNSLSLNSNSNSNSSPFKSNFLRKLSQQSRNVEENEISSNSHHNNININNHNSINNNNNENESDQPPIVSNNSNNSNNDQDILEHNGDEPGGGGGGGGGGGSDIISEDDSVFGNTGETFFDFANRRVNELNNARKILFDKSMTQCPYAPSSPLAVGGEDVVSLSSNTEQVLANDVDDEMSKRSSDVEININNEECVLASVTFDTMPIFDKTSDKLFMLDTYTVGILSSSDSSLRLYNLNVYARTFSLVRAKHFRGADVPYDACADKFKHIYIVFPDVNKIAKYALNSTSSSFSSSSSRSNRTQQMLIRELISVRDAEFRPSTIACHDDLIYVGERMKNHIRVYDRLLRLVRIISLKGVIASNHIALGVNQNVRVLMDGSDGLALWQVPSPTDNQQHQPSLSSSSSSSSSSVHHAKSSSSHHSHHRKKFTLHPEGNKATLCHFYTRMGCLEDVSVSVETPSNVLEEEEDSTSSSSTRSNIYVTDSCANEVRKFVFERGHKIVDESAYQFSHADGLPISAVANPLGHLFVLTDLPRRLLVIDQRECVASSSDHHTHS